MHCRCCPSVAHRDTCKAERPGADKPTHAELCQGWSCVTGEKSVTAALGLPARLQMRAAEWPLATGSCIQMSIPGQEAWWAEGGCLRAPRCVWLEVGTTEWQQLLFQGCDH